MNAGLFRKESIDAQRQRLYGDVVIVQPPKISALAALLFILVIAAILFAAFGTFARSEKVPGYLVPDSGLVRIVPTKDGYIQSINFALGDHVAAGDIIAVVDTGLSLASGRVIQDEALFGD